MEEQNFVTVSREGLAGATIIYLPAQRGRDVFNAKGLLDYLAEKKREKEITEDKSEIEQKLKEYQLKEHESKEKLRVRDEANEVLRTENFRLSNINLSNQNELHPIIKTLKYIDLLKWFLAVAGGGYSWSYSPI